MHTHSSQQFESGDGREGVVQLHKGPFFFVFFFLFVHFGSRHSALHFLMQGLFKAVTPLPCPPPSTVSVSRHR